MLLASVIIPLLCILSVLGAVLVLVLQWQHAQWTSTTYGQHRIRLLGADPTLVSAICAKLATLDAWIEAAGLSGDEKARMLSIIVELYGPTDSMTGTWMRLSDPGVAGTFDHRTFFLGARGQDIILLRERASTSPDLFHEFAYHAYPFILYQDPDAEHRPDFDPIRKALEVAHGKVHQG